MTPVQVIAIVSLILFALYFGRIVAAHSIRTEKIHGGNEAQWLHYAASALFASVAPSVLVGAIIFHLSLGSLVLGLSLGGLSFLCLIGFAYVELPARAKVKRNEDKGWTAEDARTSGL